MRKKRLWSPGDLFVVPLEDGTYGQGQILSLENGAINSAICAFSSRRTETVPEHIESFSEDCLIAVLFVTRDLLDSGRWQIVNSGPIVPLKKWINIDERRSRGFVGTKIIGSYIIATLLSAYHKLLPWDNFHNPNYLDTLLIRPDRRPSDVLLLKKNC